MQIKNWITISFLCWCCVLLLSCQKELTCYGAECPGVSAYSFVQNNGVCSNALVNGIYKQEAVLTDSNTVAVKVNVTKKGAYTINSDTVNGFYFKDQGEFSSIGVVTILLKGIGKPVAAGNYSFITRKASGCSFIINVDTIPYVEKYYYDVTIDGKRYQQTVGNNSVIMRNIFLPGQQTIGIISYIGTDGPFVLNDNTPNNDGLYISKSYIQTSNITLTHIAAKGPSNVNLLFFF